MALLPYIYSNPFRMMEQECLNPKISSPRDLYASSSLFPWRNVFKPLEHLSDAVNHLTLNESNSMADEEKFQVIVDVQHFAPEEVSVKVVNRQVIVEGKHEEKQDQHGYISRWFVRKYCLPEGCLPDTVHSKLSSDGVLTVIAPKVLPMPSTGEKIIPIKKTGPVRLETSAGGREASLEDNQKSVEEK